MPPEPISIAETVVYGVAFDPKNSDRVARMDLNELFASVGRLFDLLEEREVDYVLAGGVAMLAYVEGRNTQVIDLVVAEADLQKIPELRVEDKNEQFGQAWLGDLRVDLLFAECEPFKTVSRRHAADRDFKDRRIRCATPDGLLLMKLYATPSLYRQGKFSKARTYEGDIAGLLRLTGAVTDDVWATLSASLLETDVVELRRLVAEIEQKVADGGKRFGGGP